MEKWENKLGIAFFKKMGMVPGNIILDFGARIGHYTIPAARAVAERGAVYALDKDEAALAELEKKAAFSALSNIKVYKTSGDFSFNFKKNFFDYILLYDVLHFIKNSERKKLYKLLRPLLKNKGLLSVYPKHTTDDYPADEFMTLCTDDLLREITAAGFNVVKKQCGMISHDDELNHGCIYNFAKTN